MTTDKRAIDADEAPAAIPGATVGDVRNGLRKVSK